MGIFVVAVTVMMGALTTTMELIKDIRDKRVFGDHLNSMILERSSNPNIVEGERKLPSDIPGIHFVESVKPLDLVNQDGKKLEGLMEMTITLYRKEPGQPEKKLNWETIWLSSNSFR